MGTQLLALSFRPLPALKSWEPHIWILIIKIILGEVSRADAQIRIFVTDMQSVWNRHTKSQTHKQTESVFLEVDYGLQVKHPTAGCFQTSKVTQSLNFIKISLPTPIFWSFKSIFPTFFGVRSQVFMEARASQHIVHQTKKDIFCNW